MAVNITVKQQAFLNGLLEGKTQRAAYKAAYSCDNMSDKTIDEQACKTLKRPKVAARYAELMDRAASESVATAQQVLENLTRIAMAGEHEKTTDRIRALELLGKYHALFTDKQIQDGDYKISVSISGDAAEFAK